MLKKLVRVVSDIHLEHHKDPRPFIETFCALPRADYLILAGDITACNALRKLSLFLARVSPLYEKIIYVLGNHEYYYAYIPHQIPGTYRTVCRPFKNVVLLENETYVDDHVSIFGTTLWTDIHGKAVVYMNDLNFLEIGQYHEMHTKARKALEALPERSVDIVVTHHLPSYDFIAPKYQSGGTMNSGFASHCDNLFSKARKYWVFGHTHTPMRKVREDVECVCNPIGYPGENPGPAQDVVLVI